MTDEQMIQEIRKAFSSDLRKLSKLYRDYDAHGPFGDDKISFRESEIIEGIDKRFSWAEDMPWAELQDLVCEAADI